MITIGSDSDIVDDEDEPVLDTVNVIHDGGVNRIRVCVFSKILVFLYRCMLLETYCVWNMQKFT